MSRRLLTLCLLATIAASPAFGDAIASIGDIKSGADDQDFMFTRLRHSSRSALASAGHVESDSGHENASFDDVLRRILDAEKRHAVIETRHHERTEKRARHLASATHETRSTNDAGGDRIELHQSAGVR